MSDSPKIATAADRRAIVATIAQRLGDTGRLGKKAIQKYAYLLQELAGVPLAYHFRFYTYGPFSEEVASDLDIADVMGGIAISYDAEANAYSIKAADRAAQMVEEGQAFLKTNQANLDWLLSTFGHRTAKGLELTATILFLVREDETMNLLDENPLRDRVRELKPKYENTEITRAIHELKKLIDHKIN